LPKKFIAAMRSGERAMQKARRGFPAGLPAQSCQIALSTMGLRYSQWESFRSRPRFAIPEKTAKEQEHKRRA
jgi:hypothetical protein